MGTIEAKMLKEMRLLDTNERKQMIFLFQTAKCQTYLNFDSWKGMPKVKIHLRAGLATAIVTELSKTQSTRLS
jgi:hypothetical protein